MIKLYFASNTPNRFGVQLLIRHIFRELEGVDINIYLVSTWHSGGPRIASTFEKCINQDIDELMRADMLIAMYPFGNGTRSEISIALGRDIPIIALIPPEFVLHGNSLTGWSDNFPLVKFNTVSSNDYVPDLPKVTGKHLIVTDWMHKLTDVIEYLSYHFIDESGDE